MRCNVLPAPSRAAAAERAGKAVSRARRKAGKAVSRASSKAAARADNRGSRVMAAAKEAAPKANPSRQLPVLRSLA